MDDYDDELMAPGPSTRAVPVRGLDYLLSFSREALTNAVDQVQRGYVRMSIEHLSYLPPVGHWHRAEVQDDEEGHSQLVMYGHRLDFRRAADGTLDESNPAAPLGPDIIRNVYISVEPRNFENEVWESLKDESPLPVREYSAHSLLPPLIWLISVPVTWGAAQFVGPFLQRLGEGVANNFVAWIQSKAGQARDNDRDNLVEVRFDIGDHLSVSAFIPFNPHIKATVDELRIGLESIGPVAGHAGVLAEGSPAELRLAAFFYQGGDWHLGWWATSRDAYITEWFDRNHPDPQRFLGRPLLQVRPTTDPSKIEA